MRAAEGGSVYHVLNRANGRRPIFEKPADYEAFERILAEGGTRGSADLYVALTRATQRLGVLHTGPLPEALRGL